MLQLVVCSLLRRCVQVGIHFIKMWLTGAITCFYTSTEKIHFTHIPLYSNLGFSTSSYAMQPFQVLMKLGQLLDQTVRLF